MHVQFQENLVFKKVLKNVVTSLSGVVLTNTNDVNSTGTNTEEAKKAILAGAAIDAMAILDDASLDEDTDEDIVETQAVLSPKAIDELREILRSDETVREFFLLLKNRELRKEAIVKLNAHLAK